MEKDIFNDFDLNVGNSENDSLNIVALAPNEQEVGGVFNQKGEFIKSRLFKELTEDDEPLENLPPDKMFDVVYDHFKVERRCALCVAPPKLMTLAEHVYLGYGRQPYAVVKFFATYYNARITHECVKSHMEKHCDFRNVLPNLMQELENNQPLFEKVKFKELDFALNNLTLQLERIMGENVKGIELKLKQTDRVDKLINSILKIQKQRDDSLISSMNPINMLTRLIEKMHCQEDRIVLIEEAKRIKEQFLQGAIR